MPVKSGYLGGMGVLFLRHASGATHMLSARKAAKLKRLLEAGKGGQEITRFVMGGYTGFMGPDGDDWDFENLSPELIK